MSVKSKFVLPFSVKFDSEVTGGYADTLHSEYKTSTEIVNYHKDEVKLESGYGTGVTQIQSAEVELQSPFTERWVGGRSYRHVNLNTGSDNAQNRREGWHVDFQPNVIRLYSHSFLNSPPAYWTRDGRSKRPVNIANIQNEENYLGNYRENYEFLQTSGRRITNNLIVDGFVATGDLTTQFITSSLNEPYSLPDLLSQTGSRSVIVERFNAPGSKEESSRGALDREGEEMSPNIPLPFRNIKIRQPYYRQLAQHNPQFGSGSTYALLPETGTVNAVTVHKINRNRLPGTSSINDFFDNGFVTHAIPRTDIQYSWITASATTTAQQLRGYQSFRTSTYNRNLAFDDIEFISGSLVVSGSSQEFFVDNLFLNSLVKDEKTINTNTNTYSISASLSASMAEAANTPYTFTSWTSMRLGDTPVPRKLRNDNIISIIDSPNISIRKEGGNIFGFAPRRGWTTTNYEETPVTFKYLPLEHDLRFSEEGDLYQIEHEYTNTLSLFANKDLTEKLNLQTFESANRFYDYLFIKYKDEDSRDLFYEGHNYKEIIWPREENTGLNRTRKRSAYYLDRPGFDRDGYDRQLGTQRAFWRDSQSNRKRSNLSDGGYYNSMNYLSTEETGSDFTQSQQDFLSNNSYADSIATFHQAPGLDEGFYNSISLLEKISLERELFYYTSSVNKTSRRDNIYYQTHLLNVNKRSFVFDSSGEFGNVFIDSVENETLDGEKKSIGSLYRNTLYKQMLTVLSDNREDYDRFLIKQEDEEITNNPKLKFTSFIGGVELNNSSFVNNSENYNSGSVGTHEKASGTIYDLLVSGSDLYVVGQFVSVGEQTVNRIAKFDGTSWSSLGDGFNNRVSVIELSGSDIYVGGVFTSASNDTVSVNRIAKWNGTSWEAVGSGFVSGEVKAIAFSGSDIYAGGTFSGKVSKYDGSWNTLGFGLDNTVNSLLFSGSDLYAGGTFTSTGSAIALWDGADWNAVGSGFTNSAAIGSLYNVDCRTLHIFDGEVYAGGRFDNVGPSIAKWNGVSWESVGDGLPNINDGRFQYVNKIGSFENELYAVGYFRTSSFDDVAKWNGSEWAGFEKDPVGIQTLDAKSLAFMENKFYISAFNFPVYYDENFEKWKRVFSYPSVFSNDYHNQEFENNDFVFSTLDNGLIRKTEEISEKKPFFDSYEEFVQDILGKTKELSTIPEFKIGDHLQNYIEDNGGNFSSANYSFLSLDGSDENDYSSSKNGQAGYNNSFFKTFATSDILKKYEKIKSENEEESELESITLNIKGIKKLLPYNGFYPQDRTVQIANLYSDYVDNNLGGGVYNLSYKSDFFNGIIISSSNEVDTTSSTIRSISVEKYNSSLFAALGASWEDSDGKIFIYSSSVGNPLSWEQNLVKEISGSASVGVLGTVEFGQKVKLFSGSNGLNLITVANTTGSTSTRNGYLLHCSSSDGIVWSEPSALQIYGTTEYVSGSSSDSYFGQYFDLHYDTTQEKIVIAVGAFGEDNAGTNSGEVSIVTGSIVSDTIQWSSKNIVYAGSNSFNFAGVGISLASCSSGYQVVFSDHAADNPDTGIGNLLITTSSYGDAWSTPTIIAKGESDNSGTGYSKTGIGRGNLKIVDFNNKSFVFFGEPDSDVGNATQNGGIFVISSSIGNEWPSSTTFLEKKVIYYHETNNDKNPTTLSPLSFYPDYLIEAFSGSDGRLYYSFCNKDSNNIEIVYGWSDNQENFQTSENGNLLSDFNTVSGYTTLAVTGYEIDNLSLPLFIYADTADNVYALKNSLFSNFSIRIEGQESRWKNAALEPFFAPGILYNTIKSGLSVDWPCATGSLTSIQPYGFDSLVNTYYPEYFEMYRKSNENIELTSYGILRSNIDYRIPFESIIFPEKAFKEKEQTVSDLVTSTILQALSSEDPVSQAIKDTYIYGGYEPFISHLDFNDFDKIGPKNFSIPFVYKKRGSVDNGLYSMAMSNFLAETVNFFLQGKDKNSKGEMVSFISKEDSQWPKFDTSKTYYMDVSINKSNDLVMMEAFHSDLHPTGSNGEKMNGRYFGYPINKTNKEIWGAEEFTEQERRTIHNDPAYAPYTPPYFEGNAKLRLSFKPTNETVTFDDLEKGVQIEAIYDGLKDAHVDSDAYINKMSLESSLNLFGKQFGTTIDSDGLETQNTNIKYWVISPKMETPVLDFSDQELLSYQNDYSKTSGFGRGMWSGYGKSPKGDSGIQLKLDFPFPEQSGDRNSLTGSLVDLLFEDGIGNRKKKIGTIARRRKISEGLVIIPYLEKSNSQTVRISNGDNEAENNKFNFIKIEDDIFEQVKSAYRKGDIKSKDNSIAKMIEGMEKYILPPPLDFMRDNSIPKIAMYIIDIEHVLDQKDLEDIWQGLMPEISYTAQELGAGQEGDYNNHIEGINLTHRSDRVELFHGKPLDPNLRWMVFKVKQRAEKDYFKVTKDSTDDQNFTRRKKEIGRQLEDYGYNWPYDYFSLLEFAKIEIRLKHKKKEE